MIRAGLIDEAISSFFAAIAEKLSGIWAGLWAPLLDGWPLWWSWGVFILIMLAAIAAGIVVRLFLPAEWAKIPLLAIFVGILAAIAWLFGRHTMHTEMKAKLDAERARKAPKPVQKPPDQDNGGATWNPFGKW